MAVFDRQTALRRVGGQEDLLRSVTSLFVVECPKLVDRIEAAVGDSDPEELTISAHTLKGSADILAGDDVVALALQLEKIGRSGSVDGAADVLPELRTATDSLIAALQA